MYLGFALPICVIRARSRWLATCNQWNKLSFSGSQDLVSDLCPDLVCDQPVTKRLRNHSRQIMRKVQCLQSTVYSNSSYLLRCWAGKIYCQGQISNENITSITWQLLSNCDKATTPSLHILCIALVRPWPVLETGRDSWRHKILFQLKNNFYTDVSTNMQKGEPVIPSFRKFSVLIFFLWCYPSSVDPCISHLNAEISRKMNDWSEVRMLS